MAIPLLLLPLRATAQPNEIPHFVPTLRVLPLDFVPPLVTPNYDQEVLEPLHAAQVAEAAAVAARAAVIAQQAQLAEETARAAYVAPVALEIQPSQVGPLGNDYTPGQCTAYVASRVAVPQSMGNATNWEAGLLAAGWHYGLGPGSVGVSHEGFYGHVVYVDSVIGGVITISEMNALDGPYGVDTRIAGADEFIWLAP